jgi:hypothetical protein
MCCSRRYERKVHAGRRSGGAAVRVDGCTGDEAAGNTSVREAFIKDREDTPVCAVVELSAAIQAGIIEGYDDNTLRPNRFEPLSTATRGGSRRGAGPNADKQARKSAVNRQNNRNLRPAFERMPDEGFLDSIYKSRPPAWVNIQLRLPLWGYFVPLVEKLRHNVIWDKAVRIYSNKSCGTASPGLDAAWSSCDKYR